MKLDLNNEEQRKQVEKEHGCFYAQIPLELILDKNVSAAAKILYCAYHLHCQNKKSEDLKTGRCKTYIGQKALSKGLGCTPLSIKRWQKELEEWGWIKVKKRKGRFGTNVVILRATPIIAKKREKIRLGGKKEDTIGVTGEIQQRYQE